MASTTRRTVASVPACVSALPVWATDLPTIPLGGVVFEVFEGLEDFVQHELCLLLGDGGNALPKSQVRTYCGCGHVAVLDSRKDADGARGGHAAGGPAALAVALYLACRLPAVRSAFLLVHHDDLAQDMLDALHRDTVSSGSKAARASARKKPVGGDGSGWTAEEDALLARTDAVWRTAEESGSLRRALEAWTKVFGAIPDEAAGADGPRIRVPSTFRLSFERGHYSFPLLRNLDIARRTADLAYVWLNEGTAETEPRWKVSLEDADLDVTLKLIPALWTKSEAEDDGALTRIIRSCNPPGSLAILFRLPTPPPSSVPAYRRNLSAFNTMPNSTALMRYRAAALSVAVTLPETAFSTVPSGAEGASSATVKILEPCCGTGGLAVELAVALARRRREAEAASAVTASASASASAIEIYACDIDGRFTKRAGEVFRASGFHWRPGTGAASTIKEISPSTVEPGSAGGGITLINGHIDASVPEVLASFVHGPDTVDLVFTDLPWGFRVLSQNKLISLYTKLLDSFLHVLKPGGFVYLVAAGSNVLVRALEAHRDARLQAAAIAPADETAYQLRMVALPQPDCVFQGEQRPEPVPYGEEASGLRDIVIGYHVFLCVLQKLLVDVPPAKP